MIEIEIFTPDDFDKLKEPWEELQYGKDMTVFQHYIWYFGLNQQYVKNCFKKGEQAIYVVASENGNVKMIAPIHIRKYGFEYKGFGSAPGAYFIGKSGFTDYLNFIYKEFDALCFNAIIDKIKKEYKVKHFYFYFIIQKNSLDNYLSENFSDKKVSVTTCVQTLPHDSFEDFHQTMTKYSRQNIRKAFNRENKTEMEIHISEFKTISQESADEFFSIYIERSALKNELDLKKDGIKNTIIKYLNKKYNDTLKRNLKKSNYITYNMVNNPNSYMIGIFNGERKIGFIYGLMEGKNMWRNIIVCFDEEYQYYTPGRTAYFRYFRDILYADGKGTTVTTDMTRGTERHKYELGGTEHYLNNYVL